MPKRTLDEIWEQVSGLDEHPSLGVDAPPRMLNPQTGEPLGPDGRPEMSQSPTVQAPTGVADMELTGVTGLSERPRTFTDKLGGAISGVGRFIGDVTGIRGMFNASQKASEVSGEANELGASVDRAVSGLIAQAKKYAPGSTERKELLRIAQGIAESGGERADELLASVPKDRQVIGSAAKMALTAAGFAIGPAASVTSRLAQGTVQGAAYGASDAAEKGKSGGEILTGAGTGAAAGLAAAGTMEGARWLLQNGPSWLFKKVLKQKPADVRAGRDVSQFAADKGYAGSYASMEKQAETQAAKLNTSLRAKIASQSGKGLKIKTKDFFKAVADEFGQSGMKPTDVKAQLIRMNPQIRKTLEKATWTLQELDEARMSFGRINEKAFTSASEKFGAKVTNAAYGKMKESVVNSFPAGKSRKAVESLFDELKKTIWFKEAIKAAADTKGRSALFKFTDLLSIPGAIGGGLPGAIATAGAARVAQSAPVMSGSATALAWLNQHLGPTVLQKLAPAEQQALVDLFMRVTPDNQEGQPLETPIQ